MRASAAGLFAGGIITFGGGVALYQGGQVIGGLGVSGDTSCADHAIAYRMRLLAAHLNGTPLAVSAPDNISYYPVYRRPPSIRANSSSRTPRFASDITP